MTLMAKMTECFSDAVVQELFVVVQVDKSSDVEHPKINTRLTVDNPLCEVLADPTSSRSAGPIHASSYEVVVYLSAETAFHCKSDCTPGTTLN